MTAVFTYKIHRSQVTQAVNLVPGEASYLSLWQLLQDMTTMDEHDKRESQWTNYNTDNIDG